MSHNPDAVAEVIQVEFCVEFCLPLAHEMLRG